MTELLYGERLREAEEILLHALQPGIWAGAHEDAVLQSILTKYIEQAQGHTLARTMYGQVLQNAQSVWSDEGESRMESEQQRFDTDVHIAERCGVLTTGERSAQQTEKLSWSESVGSETSIGGSADMQKISDFFRRDSRRYDGGFKRY